MTMKISSEAADANRELINKMQQKWKQEQSDERMNVYLQKVTKNTMEYFKEIQNVTTQSFEVPSKGTDNVFERQHYRTGDGDVIQPPRPGSLDFKKCSSKLFLK